MMKKTDKIYVAGHLGMVGSAIVRELNRQGFENIITKGHDQLDLCQQQAVNDFFQQERPDHVVLAAAKVGGIHANSHFPADFIYDNLMIQSNVIHQAYSSGCNNLLFLGSSCIYPKFAKQPMCESALLTGELEPTNEPYAIAKIAGIKLCESYNRQFGTCYRSVMPTNLYGENDNFHRENSHVIPAMMRRFHEAKINGDKQVVVWGTGKPKREFLHVDDMAKACVHVMQLDQASYNANTEPMLSHINVGTGTDCSISELAKALKSVTGFKGELIFDTSKPDGTPRKLLDVSRLKRLGWQASIDLNKGLQSTYDWFVNNQQQFRQ